MVSSPRNFFKFHLERWLQRGIYFQLLAIAALIVTVAVVGGIAAWMLTDEFANPFTGVWWAFLRLTDPGYLGDDEGVVLRVISTMTTILGYVLFMGSLIAIMTQWLNQTMRKLESGLTPIAIKGHILIIGWSNRTPAIVRELILSKRRVKRFLDFHRLSDLRIVILAENVTSELRQELREFLGVNWNEHQFIFRSGSSLHLDHLIRVNFHQAAVAIIPGADFAVGGVRNNDARVIKTLLSISSHYLLSGTPKKLPPVVAEIFDAQKINLGYNAYKGDINMIAGDALISRLMAQNVRHKGLSFVYGELLTHSFGNQIFVRPHTQFTEKKFHELTAAFPKAILLGIVRPDGENYTSFLNPPHDFTLTANDRLVLIARNYDDTYSETGLPPISSPATMAPPLEKPTASKRRILIMGWNHKIAALLNEFNSYKHEQFEIVILSLVTIENRQTYLANTAIDSHHLTVIHIESDFTAEIKLREIKPESFNNIIILGNDWMDNEEESDARTVFGYMVLRSVLPKNSVGQEILIELMDPANEKLFQHKFGEVIISPMILSHMLAHSALVPELNAVFEDLFGPDGADIHFRSAEEMKLAGKSLTIKEIQQIANAANEIALGVRIQSEALQSHNGVHLNPDTSHHWMLKSDDEVIVLSTNPDTFPLPAD